jgi:hypothetical protein
MLFRCLYFKLEKEKYEMKEIIYLNTEIMNSMLAQLEEGLITGFAFEQNNQTSDTSGQQSVRGKKAGVNGQINVNTGMFPGGGLKLGATLGNDGSESNNQSTTILEGQKDILNKAFHDYALELLTQKLTFSDLLVENENNLKEGDLFLGESTYRFYDFDLLKRSMDYSSMQEIMLFGISGLGMDYKDAIKIVSKPNPTAKERELLPVAQQVVLAHNAAEPVVNFMKQFNIFGNYASKLLEGLTVIKTKNQIGLLKKEFLRESTESISFRTDKSRKVKYLIRVIGKKEKVFNGVNFPTIKENDIDMIPNMVLDIILGSFNIIEKGDLIVSPIAIYFE